jgi:hypothetical protein
MKVIICGIRFLTRFRIGSHFCNTGICSHFNFERKLTAIYVFSIYPTKPKPTNIKRYINHISKPEINKKKTFVWRNLMATDFLLCMFYIHLLTWVGFGLIWYVPNTLYNNSPYKVFIIHPSWPLLWSSSILAQWKH